MSIETEMTGNRTTYYSHGHSSNRLDLLTDSVRGEKRKTDVSKGKKYRSPSICPLCGIDFSNKNNYGTKYCDKYCASIALKRRVYA